MGIVTFRTIAQALALGFEVYDRKVDCTIVRKKNGAGLWQMAVCLGIAR